jgi:hypothetical protein
MAAGAGSEWDVNAASPAAQPLLARSAIPSARYYIRNSIQANRHFAADEQRSL